NDVKTLLTRYGHFSMRTSTNTEIIAKLPVIQIVATSPCFLRKGGYFVMRKPMFLQESNTIVMQAINNIIFRKNRWKIVEVCVWLNSELIPGKMWWLESQRFFQIIKAIRDALSSQAKHQVNIEIVEIFQQGFK